LHLAEPASTGGWDVRIPQARPGPPLAARTLDPKARDDLRRVLIRDQTERDAISSRLMRYRDQNGQDWADIIDFLTMHPDARRRVARVLDEIDSA
jgi:hypothetical protein